jgi:hypothetical protein
MNLIKKIFQKINFEKKQNNLKKSFKRFPVSFISVLLIFGILEFFIFYKTGLSDFYENVLSKSVLSLLVVYLS